MIAQSTKKRITEDVDVGTIANTDGVLRDDIGLGSVAGTSGLQGGEA